MKGDMQLLRAWEAHQQGDLERAAELYRRVLAQGAQREAVQNLGSILRSLNRLDAAADHYELWKETFAKDPAVAANAANCLLERGEPERAMEWVEQALTRASGDERLRRIQVKALINAGRAVEALPILRALERYNADNKEIYIDYGLAYLQSNEPQKALDCLNRYGEKNSHVELLMAIGMRKLGQLENAKNKLMSMDENQKVDSPWLKQWALLLMDSGELEMAVNAWKSVCRISPGEADAWLQLSNAKRLLQFVVEPIKILKMGILYCPKDINLWCALEKAMIGRGEWTEQLIDKWQGRNVNATNASTADICSYQFLGEGYGLIGEEELDKVAKDWEKNQKGQKELWQDQILEPIAGRRLKVGYLSKDWGWHPVSRFMLPILEHHQKNNFEVWGIDAGSKNDEMYQSIRESCEHWISVGTQQIHAAAREIADKRLDILVDLGGFTSGNTIEILLHRPAGIQLSYLGYFSYTGLKCMDGWITDRELTEDESKETLILKGGHLAIDSKLIPKTRKRRDGIFRFGCFNHSRKLSKECLGLFSDVLKECSTAILVLKSPSFIEKAEELRIINLASAAGIPINRLKLMGWTQNHSEHLDCFNDIDVNLDPTPYSGATTTCDALSMGVPVVTLRGSRPAGRLSTSILANAECKQWIARTKSDYIRIAREEWKKGIRTESERKKLQNKLMNTSFGSTKRLTRELEEIYISKRRRRG